MTTSILPAAQPLPTTGQPRPAAALPHAILGAILDGSLSPRNAQRLRDATAVVAQIAGDIQRIDTLCQEITRAAAGCARDVERCEAEIDEFATKRHALALRRAKIDAAWPHVTAAIDEDAHLAHLARENRGKELHLQGARLDAQNRAEDTQRDRTARRVTPQTLAREERAATLRERHADTAMRIARDVAASCVPTGAKHPYHAFAACAFLSAKRSGASDADAFTQTRDAVLDKLCGPPIAPEEADAHRLAYEELKAHVASAARFRAAEAALTLYATGDEA